MFSVELEQGLVDFDALGFRLRFQRLLVSGAELLPVVSRSSGGLLQLEQTPRVTLKILLVF